MVKTNSWQTANGSETDAPAVQNGLEYPWNGHRKISNRCYQRSNSTGKISNSRRQPFKRLMKNSKEMIPTIQLKK